MLLVDAGFPECALRRLPRRKSSSACDQTIAPRPQAPTNWPEASTPAMNAADPAPRTQPYSNGAAFAAPSASASASTGIGASKAACSSVSRRRAAKPWAGR
jgi:hypothetical protein